METAALAVPGTVGLNVTLTVHEAPGPTLDPQVFVWVKRVGSVPVILMPLMATAPVPSSVSVVVRVLDAPVSTVPKFRLVGFNTTTVPVPFRLTACGLPGALSVIDTSAVCGPRPLAEKITLIVQLAPGAIELRQVVVSPNSLRSAPVTLMLLIASAVEP
jgi:hypothetical protein